MLIPLASLGTFSRRGRRGHARPPSPYRSAPPPLRRRTRRRKISHRLRRAPGGRTADSRVGLCVKKRKPPPPSRLSARTAAGSSAPPRASRGERRARPQSRPPSFHKNPFRYSEFGLVCHFVDRQLAESTAMNAPAASLFYVDLCEIEE